MLGQQAFIPGEQFDDAGREAVQGADELIILGVRGFKYRAFAGQCREPLLVLGKLREQASGHGQHGLAVKRSVRLLIFLLQEMVEVVLQVLRRPAIQS